MASVCQLLSQEPSRGASHACWNGRIVSDPTTFSFSLALVADVFSLAATNTEWLTFPLPGEFPGLSLYTVDSTAIAMEVAGLVFGVISTIDVCIRLVTVAFKGSKWQADFICSQQSGQSDSCISSRFRKCAARSQRSDAHSGCAVGSCGASAAGPSTYRAVFGRKVFEPARRDVGQTGDQT